MKYKMRLNNLWPNIRKIVDVITGRCMTAYLVSCVTNIRKDVMRGLHFFPLYNKYSQHILDIGVQLICAIF